MLGLGKLYLPNLLDCDFENKKITFNVRRYIPRNIFLLLIFLGCEVPKALKYTLPII